jgi:hypothetical protein
MVKLVKDKLQNSSIEQYKDEERAVLAKRIHSAENRKTTVANYGDDDVIAPEEHLKQLQLELYRYTNDMNFKTKSMGNIMSAAFGFITRNFKEYCFKDLILVFLNLFITKFYYEIIFSLYVH